MTRASVEGGVDRGNATSAPARSAVTIPRGVDASATIFTVRKTGVQVANQRRAGTGRTNPLVEVET